MSFPCPLDTFDDIARLIMSAVFLSCFGAVWCYKTETSKTESSIADEQGFEMDRGRAAASSPVEGGW